MCEDFKNTISYNLPAKELVTQITWEPQKPLIFKRRIAKNDDNLTRRSKKTLPLRFNQETTFKIRTSRRLIVLIVKPFNYDGATYPKILRGLLGNNIKKEYRIASALHDYMLNNRHFIFEQVLAESISVNDFIRLTSLIFRQCLIEQEVDINLAFVMSFFVQIYQSTLNRKAWNVCT